MLDVTGIGPKRAERIIAGWVEQKVIREIMLFLHGNGISTSRAVPVSATRRTPVDPPKGARARTRACNRLKPFVAAARC